MAVGTVLIRFVCRYTDAVVATGWHMILGGLPLFALSGVWETDQWTHIDLAGWIELSYSTIFGSAIAYGLFFYFASLGNLTSLSSLTFLTPIFALFFGNIFLNEVLSGVQSFGVGLTLVSIYLINQRDAIANKLKSFTTPKSQNITTAAIDLNTSDEENLLLLEASSSSLATIPLQVKESEAEKSNS
jgi:drug/metabolite transporter (DMT)-like permease